MWNAACSLTYLCGLVFGLFKDQLGQQYVALVSLWFEVLFLCADQYMVFMLIGHWPWLVVLLFTGIAMSLHWTWMYNKHRHLNCKCCSVFLLLYIFTEWSINLFLALKLKVQVYTCFHNLTYGHLNSDASSVTCMRYLHLFPHSLCIRLCHYAYYFCFSSLHIKQNILRLATSPIQMLGLLHKQKVWDLGY